MKISNELKVGILALSAIFVLVWGYSYLKGQDLFSDKKIIYAEYEDVFGLTKSSTVKISGINIGLVTNIKLKEDGSQMVSVEMEIDPMVKIPKNAVAELIDQSALGGKTIILNFEGTCDGEGCVKSGDILEGKTIGLIESMTGGFEPYIKKAENSWETIDSMIKGFQAGKDGEGLGLEKTMNDFQTIIANLSVTTNRLNGLIASSSSQIEGSLTNVNKLTKGLAESEADIQRTLANVSKFTDRLDAIELEETVDSTQMTFSSVTQSLATLDGAILDIQKLIKNINEGEGTIGKLLNDDAALYVEVEGLMLSIKRLTDDLALNPERYTTVLKKKRANLTVPTKEEADILRQIDELNKRLEGLKK